VEGSEGGGERPPPVNSVAGLRELAPPAGSVAGAPWNPALTSGILCEGLWRLTAPRQRADRPPPGNALGLWKPAAVSPIPRLPSRPGLPPPARVCAA
jgi:hypothetical protein